MLESIFKGVFDTELTQTISLGDYLLCVAAALVIGIALAFAYTFRSRYTKSFLITLALIPSVVCVIIMLVNGNIGVGVAVAGAFSLIRFRSVAGSAKEIGAIFVAMATGLTVGMGYIGYAALFAVIIIILGFVFAFTSFGEHTEQREKSLRITIPENLDYSDIFEDLFFEYTKYHKLVSVKTTNMGSLFKLTYAIELKEPKKEKEFIDKLRCRNGNLEISSSIKETATDEL